MRPIRNKRWQVVGAVVVLLGLGFLAGALSMNLYHRRGRGNPVTRREAFAQALKQLNLNSDQQTKVDAILADTRAQLRDIRKEESPKVSDVRRKARERLQSVLTSEQWGQLQEKMKGRDNHPGERSSLLEKRDQE